MASSEDSDRLVRWEDTRRKHLSYTINLLLTLSVASLGFEISLILGAEFSSYLRCQQFGMLLSRIALSFAVFFGIIATVSRLCDFRWTADGIRLENEEFKKPDAASKKCMAHVAGKITWLCFWGLAAAYAIGTAILAISVFAIAMSKLG